VSEEEQGIAGIRDLVAHDRHGGGEARRPRGVGFAGKPLDRDRQPAPVSG
jgi:hypothetical protein